LLFGATFESTDNFHINLLPMVFVAHLLHVASNGRVSVDADASAVIVWDVNKKHFRVDLGKLEQLGCTKAELSEFLRRALEALLLVPAPLTVSAPLTVPEPSRDDVLAPEHHLQCPLFDEDELPWSTLDAADSQDIQLPDFEGDDSSWSCMDADLGLPDFGVHESFYSELQWPSS
jgi:hypothetical protein